MSVPTLKNEHGEADYNIWFHAIMAMSENILLVASDTDIWTYGIAHKEAGWLEGKCIVVERNVHQEYVDINSTVTAISVHPSLKQLAFPVSCLVSIYFLSGCDYVSSFFRTTKQTFVSTFVEYASYICKDGELVCMELVQGISGRQAHTLANINETAWGKLVCSVYLLKHKTLFSSERIDLMHRSMSTTPLPQDKTRLLKWLAYSDIAALDTLAKWHDFVCRVCFYHNTCSKDHECLMIPSIGALKYHRLRAEYIMKVGYSSVTVSIAQVHYTEYGWKKVGEQLQVVWDEESVLATFLTSNRSGCSCKGGCDGSTSGCKKCFRMYKPCTTRCKCHQTCRNPHNNGGKCSKCDVPSAPQNQEKHDNDIVIEELLEAEESEEEVESDTEAEGMIPVPPKDSGANFLSECDSDHDE